MSWSLKIPFVFLLFLGVLSTSKVKKKANKFWLVVFMRGKLFESFVDANFDIHYIQKRFPFKGQWFVLFSHVAVCLFFLLIFLYVEKKKYGKNISSPLLFYLCTNDHHRWKRCLSRVWIPSIMNILIL